MHLTDIRKSIDLLDAELLELLSRRFALAKRTTALKSGVRDTKREEEIRIKWLSEAKRLDLSPAFADDLLQLLLAESRRLQSAS